LPSLTFWLIKIESRHIQIIYYGAITVCKNIDLMKKHFFDKTNVKFVKLLEKLLQVIFHYVDNVKKEI